MREQHPDVKRLGARIVALRKAASLSQRALSVAMECDKSTISGWETGNFAPSAENTLRLADALGCAPAALFDFDEDQGSTDAA